MRIDCKCLALFVLLFPAVQAQAQAPEADVPAATLPGAPKAGDVRLRFLSRAEGRAALTEGPERKYYERLQLGEMRAKTGLPLQGVSLETARELTRKAYGDQVVEFSDEERTALSDAIATLQPVLKARAPLYARTPWAFIKTSPVIEGGLPHTRGDYIVLSDKVLVDIVRMHAQGQLTAPAGLWNLLVHEQTHVLERHHRAAFEALYTEAFGFRHVKLAPLPRWLTEAQVVNPDGPDADWVFPVGEGAQRHWVLPDVVLENEDKPRMPEDFNEVLLAVHEQPGAWTFADQSKPDPFVELAQDAQYTAAFPDHDEIFHPNEVAAELLGASISGWGIQNPGHPLWAKMQTWAKSALK